MKYVVCKSAYYDEDMSMTAFDAKNDDEAIKYVFEDEIRDIQADYEDDEIDISFDDITVKLSDDNGDGQPYIMILNVKTNEIIFS